MLAAIDLGSNSFRLHVGNPVGAGIEMVRSAREPTRIASGLDEHGGLSEAAIRRGIEGLNRLGDVLQVYSLSAVRAVATSTFRVASNAEAFLKAAEKALGHPIEVISGEEEARLIYLGIAQQLGKPTERRMVVDIGGGSTELVVGCGREIERPESIELGTVRQCREFFGNGRIDDSAFDAAIAYACQRFEALRAAGLPPWSVVYGSSGTIRALGEIIARNHLGDDGVTPQSLEALRQRLIGFGHIQHVALEKVRAERAESVVGGLTILIGLMQAMDVPKIRPVEGGLRLGVMWDLHGRTTAGQ